MAMIEFWWLRWYRFECWAVDRMILVWVWVVASRCVDFFGVLGGWERERERERERENWEENREMRIERDMWYIILLDSVYYFNKLYVEIEFGS